MSASAQQQSAFAQAQQRKRPRGDDGDFLDRAPIYPVQKAVGGPNPDSGQLNITNKALSSAANATDPLLSKRQRIDNVVDNVLAGIQNSQRNSKNVLAGGDSNESPPLAAISNVGDFKKEPRAYSKSEKNSSR